ncbi:unnamed protein product [Euphydryas editha]|uniref:Reverse transcriptase n=1 Tax=Euphydryas editha TaxID=104508 RepID=A0AAU9UUG2_EUPED|nr:unnamed protein product [Euphydryas editha]
MLKQKRVNISNYTKASDIILYPYGSKTPLDVRDVVLVEIPVDETCKPVSQPYRRIPIPTEKKVKQKIQELLNSDIIEEVHGPSTWISLVVPILQDNDDLRLCILMRRVNLAVMRENHPFTLYGQCYPR